VNLVRVPFDIEAKGRGKCRCYALGTMKERSSKRGMRGVFMAVAKRWAKSQHPSECCRNHWKEQDEYSIAMNQVLEFTKSAKDSIWRAVYISVSQLSLLANFGVCLWNQHYDWGRSQTMQSDPDQPLMAAQVGSKINPTFGLYSCSNLTYILVRR